MEGDICTVIGVRGPLAWSGSKGVFCYGYYLLWVVLAILLYALDPALPFPSQCHQLESVVNFLAAVRVRCHTISCCMYRHLWSGRVLTVVA